MPDSVFMVIAVVALLTYIATVMVDTMEHTEPEYIIVTQGILTEKVAGRGVDPEALAEDMIALATMHPGKEYSLRGPEGELVLTYVHKADTESAE